jgi:hypothetical protein
VITAIQRHSTGDGAAPYSLLKMITMKSADFDWDLKAEFLGSPSKGISRTIQKVASRVLTAFCMFPMNISLSSLIF